jgi:serine/threonine protein kinase
LLKDEIEVIKGASHPNLLVYSGIESAASGLFIVRQWVHGFLLYDLLRLRRSLKPEEVMAVLEPLPATLDLISERGLGLVDVSIRKLFVSCPVDVRPDEFASLAKGDARAWAKCTLKLNPLSLAPLLFRERRDWSSQTLLPSSRVLSMTQAEAGIRGTKAVRLLGRLVYELIRGRAPSLRANERPSPLPLLNEAGNQALWKACSPAGEAAPFRNCEEFWRVFKESVSDRISRVAPPPAKPEADKPSAETRETEAKERLEAERRRKQEQEQLEAEQREKQRKEPQERLKAEQQDRERLQAERRERLEARRRVREERERLEHEPQSQPPSPLVPSTLPANPEADRTPVEIPKVTYPLPPEPVEPEREKPPPSSSRRTGGKSPSKQVIIAILAIAAVMVIGGLFYVANRPQASTSPSLTVIAPPTPVTTSSPSSAASSPTPTPTATETSQFLSNARFVPISKSTRLDLGTVIWRAKPGAHPPNRDKLDDFERYGTYLRQLEYGSGKMVFFKADTTVAYLSDAEVFESGTYFLREQ